MPDSLDEKGLSVKTANEIRQELVAAYKEIYGSDINLDSNTQDGQRVDIETQLNVDLRELIKEIYNTGNPDMCRGAIQDVRYRINNLWRKGGSFTVVPITLTINRTVRLQGLDGNYNDVSATAYGFADNAGNNYYLIDSVTLLEGTHTLPFRAAKQGPIEPIVGTITNPVTILTEVTSGINNSAPTSIGVTEERDDEFSTRRQISVANRGQNSIDSMRAHLLNIEGVVEAYVYVHDFENYPSDVDADGIPLNYIWVIVEGGSNAEIAATIYGNCAGSGTKGSITIDVPTASGQTFVARFDRVVGVPLYIKFNLQETVVDTLFDIEGIKSYIAENLKYTTNEFAETSKPTDAARMAILANGGNGVPTELKISLNGQDWLDYIPSDSKLNKFTIDTEKIFITEINLDK